MSWASSASLIPTLLIVSAVLAWWFTEPKNPRINFVAAAGVLLFCWAIAPDLSREVSASVYVSSVRTIAALRLHLLLVNHANMLLTGAAVVWYVCSAWRLPRPFPFSHHSPLSPPCPSVSSLSSRDIDNSRDLVSDRV